MTIAILDANVLIPNALCDLLLRLAEENLLQPRWSPHILEEMCRHLPSADPKALHRRVNAMNAAFEERRSRTDMETAYAGPIRRPEACWS